MSKQRFSVSLSEENVEWIDANYNNRSAFIDDLITDYREGTTQAEDAVARLRLQQVEAEIASHESQVEALHEQKQAIAQSLSSTEKEREEYIQNALDALRGLEISPSHPAVKNHAKKANIPAEEFYEILMERRNDE